MPAMRTNYMQIKCMTIQVDGRAVQRTALHSETHTNPQPLKTLIACRCACPQAVRNLPRAATHQAKTACPTAD